LDTGSNNVENVNLLKKSIKELSNNYVTNDYVFEVKIRSKKILCQNMKMTNLEFDSSTNGEASICIIEFMCNVGIKYEDICSKSDFGEAKIGVNIEVSAGYSNNFGSHTSKFFEGFIFSISMEIVNGVTFLKIYSMDGRMWMMPNKNIILKRDKQKYSDILKTVTSNYSSKFSDIKIDIKNEPQESVIEIYQRNESDLEFIRKIANKISLLSYVNVGSLNLVSIEFKSGEINVEPCDAIKRVKFVSNICGIPKSVSIMSLDDKDFRKANTTNVELSNKVGEGETADNLTTNISSLHVLNFVDNSVESDEHVKFLAESELIKRSMSLANCEIETTFLPEIQLGTRVIVKKFGYPVDNKYILTHLNHRYSVDLSNDKRGVNYFGTKMGLQSDAFSI